MGLFKFVNKETGGMGGGRGGSGAVRGTKGNGSFHFVALSTILVGARDGEQILVDVLK